VSSWSRCVKADEAVSNWINAREASARSLSVLFARMADLLY
jgi:hypothetical protein